MYKVLYMRKFSCRRMRILKARKIDKIRWYQYRSFQMLESIRLTLYTSKSRLRFTIICFRSIWFLVVYKYRQCKSLFLQNCWSWHEIRSAMNDGNVEAMNWHAQSHNLNPTENPRQVIGEKVMARKPMNVDFFSRFKWGIQ